MPHRRVLSAAIVLAAVAVLSLAACSKSANSGSSDLNAAGPAPTAGSPTGTPPPTGATTATATVTKTIAKTSSEPTATKTTKKPTPKPSLSANPPSPVQAFNDKLDGPGTNQCTLGPASNGTDIMAGGRFEIEDTAGTGPNPVWVQTENRQTSAHDQVSQPLNTPFITQQDVGSISAYAGKVVWFTVYISPDGDDNPYDNKWELGIAVPSGFNSNYGTGAYPCLLPIS